MTNLMKQPLTVQQLIDRLEKVEDKSKPVGVLYHEGFNVSNSDPFVKHYDDINVGESETTVVITNDVIRKLHVRLKASVIHRDD